MPRPTSSPLALSPSPPALALASALASVLASALVLLLALASTPATAAALDAAPWDRVLSEHARRGRFDYRGLRADAARRADLAAFLEAAGRMPEGEPLSAWLNVYNALVIHAALEAGAGESLRSVQDVPGFFDRQRHLVAGRRRTLNEIENEIIRPRFHDPRAHAALNCGAQSCPPLRARAFREADLDAVLERMMRQMVSSPRFVEVRGQELRLSPIFVWYREDFERAAGSLVGYLRRYAEPGSPAAAPPEHPRVVERGYNWRLNQL